jgi:hypothetical protein
MQIEIPTSKPRVHGPNSFEVYTAVEQLWKYELHGTDLGLTQLVITKGIQKLINSIWNKEELPQKWKKYTYILSNQISLFRNY